MIVDFQIIPHKVQRYETVGDWAYCKQSTFATGCPFRCAGEDDGVHYRDVLHIRVSKLSDPRYELLVFHHELTEALLCREAGITAEMCDAWDKDYESMRALLKEGEDITQPCGCAITQTSEPGDDPHAPYFAQHHAASKIERMLATALGMDDYGWEFYCKEVEEL